VHKAIYKKWKTKHLVVVVVENEEGEVDEEVKEDENVMEEQEGSP
jgi:hypothetical protein